MVRHRIEVMKEGELDSHPVMKDIQGLNEEI
jgi:hypothetical protein